MTSLPAYEETKLALTGMCVRLRPSLRAATYLERLHDGFDRLQRHLLDFDLRTTREFILAVAVDRKEAEAFVASFEATPLLEIANATNLPLIRMLPSFMPAADDAPTSSAPGKPMTWSEAYRDLFQFATGALNWTPEAAWNATPAEIINARIGHVEYLNTIHDSGDQTDADHQPDPEQAARNIADGLDPEFDRAGLQALRARHCE